MKVYSTTDEPYCHALDCKDDGMPELGLVIDVSERILSISLPKNIKAPGIVQNLTFHEKLDHILTVTNNQRVLTHRIHDLQQDQIIVWDVILIMNNGNWTYQLVGYPSETESPVTYDYDMREN